MEIEKADKITTKQKFLLLVFGIVLGVLIISPFAFWYLNKLRGPSYKNLSELRAAMLERSSDDQRADQSVSLRSIIQPHYSDSIIYELRPNLNVKFQGVNVTTNSYGMRGKELTVEKPENIIRVALIGDSFAFGWGVEENKIFAEVIEQELNKSNTGKRYEVLNFGVPGYSTFQEVDVLEEKGLKFKPDLVLIYFVDNDWGLPFFLGGDSSSSLMSAVDFARNVWESEDPVAREQRKFLESIMNPNRAIKKLLKLGEDNNFKVALCVNPGRNYDSDRKRLWVLRKEPKLHEIAIKEDMQKIIDEQNISKSSLTLPTDPHPSEIKHRIMGELMAKEILRILSNS